MRIYFPQTLAFCRPPPDDDRFLRYDLGTTGIAIQFSLRTAVVKFDRPRTVILALFGAGTHLARLDGIMAVAGATDGSKLVNLD